MKEKLLIFTFTILLLISCKEEKLEIPKTTAVNENSIQFKKDGELSFLDEDGKFLAIVDIEIADTEQKRATGLMFREKMMENQAMLFVFPNEDFQSFWMKNTILSLDMIFVNSNKQIVNIQKDTTPFTTTNYPSTEPAIYVVEVIAGFTDKFNIQSKNSITWRITN